MEAYHAGSIREMLIQNGSYIVEPYNVTVDTIVDVRRQGSLHSFLSKSDLVEAAPT